MRNTFSLLLVIFIMLSIHACSPIYNPNAASIPYFEETGEIEISAGAGTADAEVNIAYCASDKFAISAAGQYINRSKDTFYQRKQNYGEIGLILLFNDGKMRVKNNGYKRRGEEKYNYVDCKRHLTLGLGRGYGLFSNYNYSFFLLDPDKDSLLVEGLFNKYYLQYSSIIYNEKSQVYMAARMSYVNFYQFRDSKETTLQPQSYNRLIPEFYIGNSLKLGHFDFFTQVCVILFPATGKPDFSYYPISATVGLRYNIQTLKKQ